MKIDYIVELANGEWLEWVSSPMRKALRRVPLEDSDGFIILNKKKYMTDATKQRREYYNPKWLSGIGAIIMVAGIILFFALTGPELFISGPVVGLGFFIVVVGRMLKDVTHIQLWKEGNSVAEDFLFSRTRAYDGTADRLAQYTESTAIREVLSGGMNMMLVLLALGAGVGLGFILDTIVRSFVH